MRTVSASSALRTVSSFVLKKADSRLFDEPVLLADVELAVELEAPRAEPQAAVLEERPELDERPGVASVAIAVARPDDRNLGSPRHLQEPPVGSITRRMCEMSILRCAYQPSGWRKSFWRSIRTRTVRPGTSSQRTGAKGSAPPHGWV